MSQSAVAPIPAGTLIAGKYRVGRLLGKGGMAAVFEAVNIDLGKRVAVKVLSQDLITSRVVRERFQREARATAAVRSPYICDVYDVGSYEDQPFLVMELLEGESLYDLMSRERRLTPAELLRIITHTCRGLQRAHEAGIVHRDLKPENIFLTRGEDGRVLAKVLDFGLAKFYEPLGPQGVTDRLTRQGALFGTPAYMSPEQARGDREVDRRSDLWALGCIVFECLIGQTVWNVDQGVAMILAQVANAPLPRPTEHLESLTPSFDLWFAKALAREPEARFQSALELCEALAQAFELSEAGTFTPSALPPFAELDELYGAPPSSVPPSRTHPPPPVALDAGDPSWRVAGPEVSPVANRFTGLIWLAVASLAAAGLYGAWLFMWHPATGANGLAAPSASSAPIVIASALPPLEVEGWASLVSAAQGVLRQGKPSEAMAGFERAQAAHPNNVALPLSLHLGAARAAEGSCRVRSLGRPRPFSEESPGSQPRFATVPGGLLALWTDTHHERSRRQAFAVLMDGALRRVTEPLAVTPEARSILSFSLLSAHGGELGLLFTDIGGARSDIFVRRLGADGRIASPLAKVSTGDVQQAEATWVQAPSGGVWVFWAQRSEQGVRNLHVRELTADLVPKGKVIALTRYRRQGRYPEGISDPRVAWSRGAVLVTYALERRPSSQIVMLRFPVEDGLPVWSRGGGAEADGDWTAVPSVGLTAAGEVHRLPEIACHQEGCFLAWEQDQAGGRVAFLRNTDGELLWHRELGANGTKPVVSADGDQAAVVWYEGDRVRFAPLSIDGFGTASTVGKLKGTHPGATVLHVPGTRQWWVGWRDFEAGHWEAYAAEVDCP